MPYALIAASLVYGFLNGFHDSSSIVATVISSRALRPRTALFMTALAEFTAPFLFGVAVANTLGRDLIVPGAISSQVVIAGVGAAIIWSIATWFIGIPSSSSHALIGGLLGAAIFAGGTGTIQLGGMVKILVALFISPPLGMLFGYLFMLVTLNAFSGASPSVNLLFKRLQILTSLTLALAHGSIDSQKTMGIIVLGLVTVGLQSSYIVPLWVVAASAAAISLGIASGGWRLIRTLGGRIYKIRPVHAFTSQSASAVVILGAVFFGGPISATQVVSSAIMGAGAAERVNMVRWQVAGYMLLTWILTIPASALLAMGVYGMLSLLI